MAKQIYKYLDNIDSPADLKKLTPDELVTLAAEVRDFMIEELAVNPGHLGSSLGAVELAIAIHYVFDTPRDKVIWDVGHQAYTHKILTGRRESFSTNRKLGGISGFPKMSESPYDAFGGGHSSVSISAALGMAVSNELEGSDAKVLAVIGDGAISNGLAFEGLNNAGAANADLLVILNDNEMSISPNVGALKEYLTSMSTSRKYNAFKNRTWHRLAGRPRFRKWVQKMSNLVKHSIFQRSNLFESLGFRYFGPIDGHDLKALIDRLEELKHIGGAKLLHLATVKGKGYDPAEKDKPLWHAPGKFDPATGSLICGTTVGVPAKYQDVFGHVLVELAKRDERVVGITPAMLTGCSMDIMVKEMPDRCFDVGIAEGHAVTFSAGLAAQGMVPFCNIYSSFMQRAYDNLLHDVALQNLHVVFCLDRAGLVGEDGATHHGSFDLAYLRSVPNVVTAAPMDERELRNMMYTALKHDGPFAIRYPRGSGIGADWCGEFEEYRIGKGRKLREGTDVALISIGTAGNDAAKAVELATRNGISVEHIDMRFAKPLDVEILHEIGRNFRKVVTVEDGVLQGGVGSAVLEFFGDNGYCPRVIRLGIGDTFIEHGTMEELHRLAGYDTDSIYNALKIINADK